MDDDATGDWCDLDDGMIHMSFETVYRLDWQEELGASVWNLYRGDLEVLRQTGEYTQLQDSNPLARRDCGLLTSWIDDLMTPAAGRGAFYLTTQVDEGVESSMGQDSNGQQRANNNPCP